MAELLRQLNRIKGDLKIIDILDMKIGISIGGTRSQFNRLMEYLEDRGIIVDEETWGKAYNAHGIDLCFHIERKRGIMYADTEWYSKQGYIIYEYDEINLI